MSHKELTDSAIKQNVTLRNLTITGVDNNDVASYRCVVTNAYGSITSSVATLTVTNAPNVPPSITLQPSNQTVNVGGAASFRVLYCLNRLQRGAGRILDRLRQKEGLSYGAGSAVGVSAVGSFCTVEPRRWSSLRQYASKSEKPHFTRA